MDSLRGCFCFAVALVWLAPAAQAAECSSSQRVAFSASGTNHTSSGARVRLSYDRTITNVGGSWVGSLFFAPCDGLYVFTVSFVKDPYNAGTNDDVYVEIKKNNTDDLGFAWAGAMSATGRSTGTYTVTALLQAGDFVQTFASADGRTRSLGRYNFTGYLIR